MHADNIAALSLLAALIVLGATLAVMRFDAHLHRSRNANTEAARRQWARTLADASFDGLLIHRQGLILQMNRALARMLATREREWLGQHFANLARPDQTAALRAELEAPHPQIAEFCLLRANKSELHVEISSQNIDHDGAPATVTAIRDITQRLADAQRIARLTHYDPLTSLPNRKLFHDKLEDALKQHDRAQGSVSLFTLDIDQFKAMNTQLGRTGGDALLKQIAARIVTLLAREDILARLGGDKFAILLITPGPANRAASLGGQLAAAFHEPFIVEGHLVRITLSIGIAIYPDHAADADGLLKASAFALSHAERAGGGRAHMFSHAEASAARIARTPATSQVTDLHRLAPELRLAFAAGDIRLAYQPFFRLSDLAPLGFEATPTWHHPAEGPISLDRLTPLAEIAGLTPELGVFTLESACAEAAAAGGPRIAVNLTPAQLRDVNLPARISATLRKTGLAAALLELEIAESLLADPRASLSGLGPLAALGLHLALDDFGTGHSSLAALTGLPFTRLKIDRRVISKLGVEPSADAIISALISLAQTLRLEVTALGVERPEQLDHLRRLGCHVVQGPLLGPPTPRATAAPPLSAPPRPALVVNRA